MKNYNEEELEELRERYKIYKSLFPNLSDEEIYKKMDE